MDGLKIIKDLVVRCEEGLILEDTLIYILRSLFLATEGKPTVRAYRDKDGILISY